MRNILRALGVVLACICFAIVSSGCASVSADSQAPNAWRARFEEEYRNTQSEFVRAVLRSGEITLSDLQEAQEHTVQCWADRGVVGGFSSDDTGVWNSYFYGDISDDDWENINYCRTEWLGPIDELYHVTRFDPNMDGLDAQIVACLVRHGLAPAALTTYEYNAILDATALHFSGDGEVKVTLEEWLSHQEEVGRPQLPNGVYLDEGLAWGCRVDPRV